MKSPLRILLSISISVFFLIAEKESQVFAQSLNSLPPELQALINQGTQPTNPTGTSTLTLIVSPDPPESGEMLAAFAQSSNSVLDSSQFSWYVNNIPRADLSGQGRNSAFFVVPASLHTLRLKVVANNGSGSTTVEKVFQIQPSAVQKLIQGVQSQVQDAQQLIDQTQQNNNDIVIDTTPDTPMPGDQVTFTARSLQTNLDNADITWLINGKVFQNGKGLTSITFPAGHTGTTNSVEVRVNNAFGGTYNSASTVSIVEPIKFYWWAASYVPAWYQGKALPSSSSTIFIQARPSFSDAITKSLIYKWYLNDNFVPEVSGVGKSTFAYTVPGTEGFQDSIVVKVTNAAGTFTGNATFDVPQFDPEVLLYEMKPLEGIETSETLTSITRTAGKSLDITAEPFFAPRASLASFDYQWTLNGKSIPSAGTKRPWVFTLTSAPDTTGTQNISLAIKNIRTSVLEAAKSLQITLK